jgi:hypothetical protein
MWKDIEGFKGKYKVNALGEILSTSRDKIMSQQLGINGYYKVGLWKDGTKDRHIVHRIVAKHFVSNPHNKPQVNHIDGNKLNNNASNLEWCTPSENSQHAFDTGLRKEHYKNIGKKFGSSSKYHYVCRKTCKRKGNKQDEHYYLAEVKATIAGKVFKRSKQFAITKYGELEAERLAAEAANEIVKSYKEFDGYALNVFGKSLTTIPKGSRIQAIGIRNGKHPNGMKI